MRLGSLLLYASPFLSIFASGLSSDITARSVGTTTYTVRPVDRANTYETEQLLRSRYGEENVITNRYNGIFMSWTITSPNSQLAGAIEALEGVQNVDSKHENHDQDHHQLRARDAGSSPPVVEDKQTPATQPQGEDLSLRSAPVELDRRDVPWYVCLANNTDVQKTEEFLNSKIQTGTKYLQMRSGKEVLGWWKLYLDDDAKKAVEAYEGIRGFRPGGDKIKEFRAISSSNEPQPSNDSGGLTAKDRPWERRSGSWIKQENADKALVMDSQYK